MRETYFVYQYVWKCVPKLKGGKLYKMCNYNKIRGLSDIEANKMSFVVIGIG